MKGGDANVTMGKKTVLRSMITCLISVLLLSVSHGNFWELEIPEVAAKDKDVTLTWTQTLPTPNDLAGWRIYVSETSGGPYRPLGFVPYVSTSGTYSWTLDKLHNLNLKKKANMYFVISSVDNAENESGYSDETAVQVDDAPTGDTTAPAKPTGVMASKK